MRRGRAATHRTLSYSILFLDMVLVFNVWYSLNFSCASLFAAATYRSSSHAIYTRCQLEYGHLPSRKIGYGPLATRSSPLLFGPVALRHAHMLCIPSIPHIMHRSYALHYNP